MVCGLVSHDAKKRPDKSLDVVWPNLPIVTKAICNKIHNIVKILGDWVLEIIAETVCAFLASTALDCMKVVERLENMCFDVVSSIGRSENPTFCPARRIPAKDTSSWGRTFVSHSLQSTICPCFLPRLVNPRPSVLRARIP